MDTLTIIAFTLYLLAVVAVALVAYRVTKNLSDFVLGGRRLGGPVAALSAGASDMSAWLLLGLPGAVFALGLSQIWLPIGLTLGAYLSWRIVARPLRIFSEVAGDSVTVPSFIGHRFKDKTGTVRMVLAIVTIFFFAFYTASGLVGGAMLLQRFHFDYHYALWLGTSIVVGYTFIGGFLAVSWTDFFQGTLMFICLILVPILATMELGGIDTTLQFIEAEDPKLLSPLANVNALMLINLFAWGLGYFGQPHIIVRYMAVTHANVIPLARKIAISWMSLSLVGALLTGFVGIAFFEKHGINSESVFILFSEQLFSPWMVGILFAAILSSIMCAIDSQMLASSSALTEDIYRVVFRKKASAQELVWVGRFAVIIIAVIAVYLASDPNSKVIDLVAFSWAGLAAAFGPAVLFSLFWRRSTRNGVLAGIISGTASVLVWKVCSGGIFELYEILPGFIVSSLTIFVVSKWDHPPSQDVLEQFDRAWQLIHKK